MAVPPWPPGWMAARCTVCGASDAAILAPAPISGHTGHWLCGDCLDVCHSGVVAVEHSGATIAVVTRQQAGRAHVGMEVDRQTRGPAQRLGTAWRALVRPEPVNAQGVPLRAFSTVAIAQLANRLLLALGALNTEGDGGVWPAAVPVVGTAVQRHDPAPVEHYRWGALTLTAGLTCTRCGAKATLTARDTISHEGGWEPCPGGCGLERRVAVQVREREQG